MLKYCDIKQNLGTLLIFGKPVLTLNRYLGSFAKTLDSTVTCSIPFAYIAWDDDDTDKLSTDNRAVCIHVRSVGIGCSHIHSHICNLDDLAMMSARDGIRGLRSNRTHTKGLFWTAASRTKSVPPICDESAGKFAIHYYEFPQQHLHCPLFSPWTSDMTSSTPS